MSQSTSTEIKQPRAEVDFWLFSEVVAGFIQVGLFGSIAAHCCLRCSLHSFSTSRASASLESVTRHGDETS